MHWQVRVLSWSDPASAALGMCSPRTALKMLELGRRSAIQAQAQGCSGQGGSVILLGHCQVTVTACIAALALLHGKALSA